MSAAGPDRSFYSLASTNGALLTRFSCDGTLAWSNAVVGGTYWVEQSDTLLSNNWSGFMSGVSTSVYSSINVSAPTETLADDFEGSGSPSLWKLGLGTEFPGATGSLTRTTGYVGHGARLAYDFRSGGKYVSAGLSLTQSLATVVAVAFRVRSPPGIHINLRVTDKGGQTFQYNLNRPFEADDPSAWRTHVVDLAVPNIYWGGSNDGIIHGKITWIYLLAADPQEATAVGAVDFDDVRLIEQWVVNLDPFTLPTAPAPAGSSNLTSLLGVNIHFTHDDAALDAARSAGFSWIRMDLDWQSVEAVTGVYNFASYDGLVTDLEVRNMKALFILDYGNSLYTGGYKQPPTNAPAIKAFGNFSEAAARHFAGRPVCFEVWNEPNISGFWPPSPSAAQYATLATSAVARVHAGNPSAKVTTGGLSGTDCSFLRACLSAGGGNGADAIGVHPYRSSAPESASDDILACRSIISGLVPSSPPLWDTEWGYSSSWFGDGHASTSRQRQAVMAARELLTAWSLGFPLIIYYDIRDDGADPANAEHNFGLLMQNGSDKPAMQAVRTLTATARDRQLTGFLSLSTSRLCALRLDGTNTVVVAWATAGDVTALIPSCATATDVLGLPITLQPAGPLRSLTFREADGPVYLTFPKLAEGALGSAIAALAVPEPAFR